MVDTMGRYRDILDVTKATDTPPMFGQIYYRNTDVYIQYNSADRLDLISNRVYGTPKYWWVILAANEYQLEFEIGDGEILRIPMPISDAIQDIKREI